MQYASEQLVAQAYIGLKIITCNDNVPPGWDLLFSFKECISDNRQQPRISNSTYAV